MQRAWTRGAALAALFGGALSGCLDLGSSFEATEGPPEVPLPTCEEVGCAAVKHIETAGIGTCALLENGEIRCWGSLEGLPLGDGQTGYLGDDEVPGDQGSVDVGGPAQQLSTNCALLLDGAVRCWGSGRVGLGYGDRDDVGDDEPPAAKPPIAVGFPVVEIDAHSTRMCARSAAGEVRCWGLDDDGALGRGISASLDCVHDGGEYEETYYDCERHPDCCVGDDEPPSASPPLELGGPAIQLSNGCALLEGGDVRCWGSNLSGQLGLGHTRTIGDNEVPASVDPISLGGPAIQIASSRVHACALLEGGDVRCWGSGSSGVLGYGNTDDIGDDELPSDVGPVSLGGSAVEVAVGYAVSCALRADGALYCWGSGHFGSLGRGSSVDIGDDELPSDASPIDLGRPVKQIAPGYTTCAILDDGLVRCWGRGFYGELGSGRTGPCRDTYSCHVRATCCIGDVPGELPPSPVVLF